MPIDDQPSPQPTSATRPPARRAASTSGIDGRYSRPSGPRNSGRLAPAWPSRASAPSCAQLTPPPVRKASTSWSTCLTKPIVARANGATCPRSSSSVSGATYAAGRV